MTSYQCGMLPIFKRSSLQVLCTSTGAFPFQNLSSHYVVGYQVVTILPIKHHEVTDQYRIRSAAMLELGQWVEQCNLTMLGLQICLKHIYFCVSLSPLLTIQCLAFFTSIDPTTLLWVSIHTSKLIKECEWWYWLHSI